MKKVRIPSSTKDDRRALMLLAECLDDYKHGRRSRLSTMQRFRSIIYYWQQGDLTHIPNSLRFKIKG